MASSLATLQILEVPSPLSNERAWDTCRCPSTYPSVHAPGRPAGPIRSQAPCNSGPPAFIHTKLSGSYADVLARAGPAGRITVVKPQGVLTTKVSRFQKGGRENENHPIGSIQTELGVLSRTQVSFLHS